ncbi:uncharacterized protein [Dendropsophus ebraccatus]|uniref:uncharacterized protein n=1 Tax=Dendropsophus ebraccatus TaxID=150705 RepID=UPI003831186A
MYKPNDFTKDFIEVYHSLPALWKVKSKDYSHRQKKNEALGQLLKVSRKYVPNADLKMVKQKIQNLRTVYRKELNKVEASKKSGTGAHEVYHPNLWYFDLLAFTNDHEAARDTLCILENNEDDDLDNTNEDDLAGNVDQFTSEMSQPISEQDTPGTSQNASQSPGGPSSSSSSTFSRQATVRARKRIREQQQRTRELLTHTEKLASGAPDQSAT